MLPHIIIKSQSLTSDEASLLASSSLPIYLQNLSPIGDAKSISILQVRELINDTSLTRSNYLNVYQIYPAHTLSTPAQNLLLKTLEESRENQLFLLVTPFPNQLLETIHSRCRLIKDLHKSSLTSEEKSELTKLLNTLKSPIHVLIQSSDQITKNDPVKFFARLITLLSQAVKNDPSPTRIKILKLASNTYKNLLTNVNSKLAVDHFLLQSQRTIMNHTYGR